MGNLFENRTIWLLGLVVVAVLAALGMAYQGYRTTPPAPTPGGLVAGGSGEDQDPNAPRLFDRSEPIRVHVAGAVRKPGVYSLPAWARVIDAIKKAGGGTTEADLDAINLADRLQDAEQLRVPMKGRPGSLTAHQPTPEPPPVPPNAGGHGIGRYPFALANKTVVPSTPNATR
jgi:competence protein ComEA